MNISRWLLVTLLVLSSSWAASAQENNVPSRILIILDQSASMGQQWSGGKAKNRAAAELILQIMDSVYAVNKDAQFSLRAFGHQSPSMEKDCYDSRNEVPFGKQNRVQMELRLADLKPLGVTPLAYSLQQVSQHDLTDISQHAYSVVLIADGWESCGGDVCKMSKELINDKIIFRPFIISLDDQPGLRASYSCMGDYLNIATEKDMALAVSKIVGRFRPALKLTKAAYAALLPMYGLPPAAETNLAERKISTDSLPEVKADKPVAVPVKGVATAAARPLGTSTQNGGDVRKAVPRQLPTPPVIAIDTATPATMPGGSEEVKNGEQAGFWVKVYDARETTLELVFVNQNGQFYLTKPRVLLLAAGTTNVVRDFYRKVDGLANVDVMKNIAPGKYDINFPAKRGFGVKNVPVADRKRNVVFISVRDPKLTFAYIGAPERKVSEYRATIKETNKVKARTIIQRCTDTVVYQPGNYDIEINTFPRTRMNTGFDFNQDSVIMIPQPGFLTVTGTDMDTHAATLYQLIDNKYYFFYTLDLDDPESKVLPTLPGQYELHYQKGTLAEPGPEFTYPFSVTSLGDLTIELKGNPKREGNTEVFEQY